MQTTPGTSLTDDTASSPSPRRSHRLLWAAVALGVLAMDQASKWWAEHTLDDGSVQPVIGDWLQLRLTYNPGAAFSMGTSYTVLLTLIAIAVVIVVLRLTRSLGSLGWALALGLLLGGALGNITDRLFREPAPFRGHVVDFIELPHWPVFNLADSAIFVAAALLVLLNLRGIHLDGSTTSAVTTESDES
jgi:signal peptidase II